MSDERQFSSKDKTRIVLGYWRLLAEDDGIDSVELNRKLDAFLEHEGVDERFHATWESEHREKTPDPFNDNGAVNWDVVNKANRDLISIELKSLNDTVRRFGKQIDDLEKECKRLKGFLFIGLLVFGPITWDFLLKVLAWLGLNS